MILPSIEHPERFAGLYVYDFGEWTSVGYTAEEIAVLLESEEHREGKVYKIQRVSPEGGMELRGIAATRFTIESGMFFHQTDLDDAKGDFEGLKELAEATPPPCRAFLHLAERETEGESAYLTALIYPAEYEDEIGRWLVEAGYEGGITVEGGPSHVTNYYEERIEPLERAQLRGRPSIPSRSADEVLAEVRNPIQRLLDEAA